MPDARELLGSASADLAAAGVGSPWVDAELLLADVLGVSRALLALAPSVSDADAEAFRALVARRVEREPLQHIVGTAPFRFLELEVGQGVFVPRPETELLVDVALPGLIERSATAQPVVVDLCAGSGAIALSIVRELPSADVTAVELDPQALVWLRRNAANLAGLTGTEIAIQQGDVRDPGLLVHLHGTVDAVLSNPPYVPEGTSVEPEVSADPAQAVFAGVDGLDLMPAVIGQAARLLRPGGQLVIEHDDTHSELLPNLLRADGRWSAIEVHQDLTGRARFSTALRDH